MGEDSPLLGYKSLLLGEDSPSSVEDGSLLYEDSLLFVYKSLLMGKESPSLGKKEYLALIKHLQKRFINLIFHALAPLFPIALIVLIL